MKTGTMTSRRLLSVAAVSALAALALPGRLAAQGRPLAPAGQQRLVRYSVTDLGTLGGSSSFAFGAPSPQGHVGGSATLPGGNQHPFLWKNGTMTDLGTLGGPNGGAAGPNGRDQLAVIAETATRDPLGENFCGFGTGLTCRGAVWTAGSLRPLPTLGGDNAEAFAINTGGQLVGVAESSTTDSSCPRPHVLAFEAALWGPRTGGDGVQALRPLPGDTVGFALALNDRGQAVGASGSCATTVLVPLEYGPHAVLWTRGAPVNLGSLGGQLMSTAAAVNERDEVIGASDLPGDTAPCTPACHSFLWTKQTGMQDLGALPGDAWSAGGWINNKGEVVGWSCAANFLTAPPTVCRAYLWHHNVLADLNALIPPDAPLRLLQAFGINDEGQIVGLGQTRSGALHAFLATPAT